MIMTARILRFCAAPVAGLLALVQPEPAKAAGDLLVAPTRVVLEGRRSAEVILNNIGSQPATYRISLELRRMQPNGSLDEVPAEAANAAETSALDLIRYAPRRVTLAPNQPQSVRIGIGDMTSLPDGEYRAHMLFRAIPDAQPAGTPVADTDGVKIEIRPIYGVTIPVIIRKGQLRATAALSGAALQGSVLSFDLRREGSRSIYGELRAIAGGQSEPLLTMKGIGVYPEVTSRRFELQLNAEQLAKLKGPVTLQFWETGEAGATLAAETKASF